MRGVSDTPCFAFRLTLVYPRAYGVDLGVVEVTYSYRGLSPRVCGVDLTRPDGTVILNGLSPRVRGRFLHFVGHCEYRFIPACAG